MAQQVSSPPAQLGIAHHRRARVFRWERVVPYILIAPAFLVMLGIIFYPIVNNIWASFYSEQTLSRPSEFVGLDQYRNVIDDPVFYPALKRTLVWTFGVTAMQFLLGLMFALLLNKAFPGRSMVRSLALIPWIMPGIVVAVVWRFLYAGDFGVINQVLRDVGLGRLAEPWLTNLSTAMPAVMVVGIWKGYGFYMIMLLAGLQSIPTDVIEAARLDGAGRFRMLRDITMPLIRPVILMALVLGMIWTSNYFEAIYVLTGGGPARATETLPIFIYNTAFQFFRLNEAIAAAILLLLLVMTLVMIYLVMFLRMNREEDVL